MRIVLDGIGNFPMVGEPLVIYMAMCSIFFRNIEGRDTAENCSESTLSHGRYPTLLLWQTGHHLSILKPAAFPTPLPQAVFSSLPSIANIFSPGYQIDDSYEKSTTVNG